jgi:hypothetical protein
LTKESCGSGVSIRGLQRFGASGEEARPAELLFDQ